MGSGLCWNGDSRLGVYEDSVTLRCYCTICAANEIMSSRNVNVQFLSDLVPLEVGERVECWTCAEFYEGFGYVEEVSTELKNGGTPVHPAYLVQLESRDEKLWFTPICLKRAKGERIG